MPIDAGHVNALGTERISKLIILSALVFLGIFRFYFFVST